MGLEHSGAHDSCDCDTCQRLRAEAVLKLIRATDLAPLPEDGSETLDLAMRHAFLWQVREIARLRSELATAQAALRAIATNTPILDKDNPEAKGA